MSTIKPTVLHPSQSTGRRLGFCALIFLSLSLPFLMSKLNLYRRSSIYLTAPADHSYYSFIYDQIFNHPEPLDIAFVGPSLLWAAIDTPWIQSQFEKKYGRPFHITTLGWNWPGEGLKNIVLRDLLSKRRVQLVVTLVFEEVVQSVNIHPLTGYWLQYDDLALIDGDLNLFNRLQYYGLAVLGAPRHLLSSIRPDAIADISALTREHGAKKVASGYCGAPFVRTDFSPPSFPAEDLIFSEKTHEQFEFKAEPLSANNQFLIREMMAQVSSQGSHLAFLHVNPFAEHNSDKVKEEANWNEIVGTSVPIMGIPSQKLFSGLSDSDIRKLYYDEHLNQNGNHFFSQTIFPALVKVYEQTQTHFN